LVEKKLRNSLKGAAGPLRCGAPLRSLAQGRGRSVETAVYISAKQPYISAKEPYISAKESDIESDGSTSAEELEEDGEED